MKVFPVHPLLWSSLLVFWLSQSETEGNNSDVCKEEATEHIHVQNSTAWALVDKTDVKETFICLRYPTNKLNCSWLFHTLEKDSQLSVHISVCKDDVAVQSLNCSSVDRVGSLSLILTEHEMSSVVLHFNMSLHYKWTAYTYVYEKERLDFLSPPLNISASVKDGHLSVTWDLPHSESSSKPTCFEYQLDMGDQEEPKNVIGLLSYKEPNADPTRTYRVRLRTRMTNNCFGCPQWSAWSHTVTVEPSVHILNPLVIISISLGIPMMLLAVLLLVRHHRVSDILFPPIPRPPAKYKYFLEKNDAFSIFHPAPPAKPEEEITEVEDAEQNPGKTF